MADEQMQNEMNRNRYKRQLPIAKNEEVEFAMDAADAEDMEALERANEADNRQENR